MIIAETRRKWWILTAMGLALGLILLDETVVGVALPTIRKDLELSRIGSHWVVNAYLLVLAVLAAAAGKLASLACDVAESGTALIAALALLVSWLWLDARPRFAGRR